MTYAKTTPGGGGFLPGGLPNGAADSILSTYHAGAARRMALRRGGHYVYHQRSV